MLKRGTRDGLKGSSTHCSWAVLIFGSQHPHGVKMSVTPGTCSSHTYMQTVIHIK